MFMFSYLIAKIEILTENNISTPILFNRVWSEANLNVRYFVMNISVNTDYLY